MGRRMNDSERVIGDAALLFLQRSSGCECNVLLDKNQWWKEQDDGVTRCRKKVTKMMSWKIRKQNRNRARKNRKSPEDGRARSRKSRLLQYAAAKESEKNLEGRPGKQLRRVHLTRVQAYELVVSETSEIGDKKRLWKWDGRELMAKEDDQVRYVKRHHHQLMAKEDIIKLKVVPCIQRKCSVFFVALWTKHR